MTCKDCIHFEVCYKRECVPNGDYANKCGDCLTESDFKKPKGKWTYIGQSEVTGLKIVKCTNCHKRQYGSMDYCGNCGADMRGDV